MSYDEIVKLEKKLNDADSVTDVDTRHVAEELFDDKILIVGLNGAALTKEYILNNFHTALNKPYTKVVIEKLDITVFDDSAIVHSLNTYHTKTAEPVQILFLRVWRKKDGQWRIVGGSGTLVAKP